MFNLAVGFTARMHKRAAIPEDETASGSGKKRPGQSPPDKGAQKD